MGTPVTDSEFAELLAGFSRSAFRLEAQPEYAVTEEREALERFLAGVPGRPSDYGWWQDWLDMIRSLAAERRIFSRVRVLAEPLTDYQRWESWGDPWHVRAGERICYLPWSRATRIGLPVECDWWLLDGERVILMDFSGGELASTLITDPGEVAPYLAWRDLAVRNATPAGEIAAA